MSKPITIIIDTREQEPYSFSPERVTAIRRALPAGDYSLEGRETEFAVERKSLADFVQTVIRDRERFRRELLRLKSYRRACVVLEGSMADITQRRYPGGAHPASVLGALISIIIDYDIPVYLCGDRPHACRFVEDYLHRCAQLAPRPSLERCESENPIHECHAHPVHHPAGAADCQPVDRDCPSATNA
jgi:ERCC4-type nuclease